jgi:hypothetical protein
LQLEVKELLAKAAAADAQEQSAGLEIPAELARREKRLAALKEARRIIEERAQQAAAAKQSEYEAKLAERQAKREKGNKPRGKDPQPPSAEPEPKAQYNFTDPESRIMKVGSSGPFEQAYNAQAAVDQNMIIVGAELSQAPNDKEQLNPTLATVPPQLQPEIKAVLVDSGYYSEASVQAAEQNPDGTPTGVTVYAAVERLRHHRTVQDLIQKNEPDPPPAAATPKEHMAHRLKAKAGRELYKLRKQTVEPVFGIIKEVMGCRRFRLRGREKVSLEWKLVCLSYNLKRMFTLKNQAITL